MATVKGTDIRQATAAYERWLGAQMTIVTADLRHKHERMAESPFVFLRGTFYRWIERWPVICPEIVHAPRVLAVGDLHVENFGTWRDAEGRLVWGVNDVDEAWPLPYTQDLTRLATSALFAIRTCQFKLLPRVACAAILEGYRRGLEVGGRALVLAERRRWLREIALSEERAPVVFWEKIDANRPARGAIPHKVLRDSLPDHRAPYRVVRRVAGVGSLGRQRFVALTDWFGSRIAREAKAFAPSAAELVMGTGNTRRAGGRPLGAELLSRAVRGADPFFRIADGWIVRRLAPDCSRIELQDLAAARDERRLLRAMGFETANMHLGSVTRQTLLADLVARKPSWLRRAAIQMADVVEADWRDWRSGG